MKTLKAFVFALLDSISPGGFLHNFMSQKIYRLKKEKHSDRNNQSSSVNPPVYLK